jgi:hypothetical protein
MMHSDGYTLLFQVKCFSEFVEMMIVDEIGEIYDNVIIDKFSMPFF